MDERYKALKACWSAGDRERDRALHLLFLAWMHWADPPNITGLSDDPDDVALWHEIFGWFGGVESLDAEFLWAAGLMAALFPWALGEETLWERRGKKMQARACQLRPQGFPASEFEGRGDYGKYFAHHAQVAPSPCGKGG